MLARDLLTSPWPDGLAHAEINPLVEQDALLEAQALAISFDVKRATLGILLELRTSMMMTESNTGVLVAQGVQEFGWRGEARDTELTAWSILGSSVDQSPDLTMKLQFHPYAQMTIAMSSLRYLNVDAKEIGTDPPDYSLDRESIEASIATWESEIAIVSGSSSTTAS